MAGVALRECVCGVFWMCEFPHAQALAPDLNSPRRGMQQGLRLVSWGVGMEKVLELCHVVTKLGELWLSGGGLTAWEAS